MRLAYFSPLPPSRTGIADYSAALLQELTQLAQVDVFTDPPADFDPELYDECVYHMGNNAFHVNICDLALRHPGVIVLHEANLHHLHAERTIRRDRWDEYVAGVEEDSGPEALAYAERVRRLEVGPDYDGVPMLRQLLKASKAVIVHSDYVGAACRQYGFTGPIGRIWHGAWTDDASVQRRVETRSRLGLKPGTPLIGTFGFLKPYKRIAESLRAFRRLLRVQPEARMILVGEPHPVLALDSLLAGLQLESSVRVIGFAEAQEFDDLIAACDVVLNLRFPTVGESSGSLLRALSFARPTIVSDVGAFAEYPDSILLKCPLGEAEEDTLYELLSLLCTRRDLAAELGERARAWVRNECSWSIAAQQYAGFLQAVHEQRPWPADQPAPAAETYGAHVPTAYLKSWAVDEGSRGYIDQHANRFARTLALTPMGGPGKSVLEMGAYLQITPSLKTKLHYEHVRGAYYGAAGYSDEKHVVSSEGESFSCTVDHFNAEKDPYPYANESYDTVLCCELLEHLAEDPMFLMAEIHRILKPGGHLVLTTPNASSARAIAAILQGYHPGFFPAYILPRRPGEEAEARHNREYTPRELYRLFYDAGFDILRLETGEFAEETHPELEWITALLRSQHLETELRGDDTFIVGRKAGPLRERYPIWLYQ
jgi:glycosyltransferase involved in cell wall biosynthesis/SAM-dependent methyltransferase